MGLSVWKVAMAVVEEGAVDWCLVNSLLKSLKLPNKPLPWNWTGLGREDQTMDGVSTCQKHHSFHSNAALASTARVF